MFSEWISTSKMDRSRRERRPGASVLAPEISWYHVLQLFLVGVRKEAVYVPSIPTTLYDLKNRITNCGELSDARHSSSGVERIQLPSICYPCGRRGAFWTFINFIWVSSNVIYIIFFTSSNFKIQNYEIDFIFWITLHLVLSGIK
jgi:hypothetical protein